MARNPVAERIMEQVGKLPLEEQRRVLEFAEALAITKPRGVPGKELLRFAGAIPRDQLKQMSDAIEEGCEQIDAGSW